MSRQKITRPLASYESTGKVKRGGRMMADTYARITDSILLSPAFQDLKPHLQVLYLAMRLQDVGKRKPNRDYDESSPAWEKVRSEQCFYFPFHTARQYCPRYRGNSGRLYADIDVLIEHGFVEKVLSGKNARENNVYRYSDRWQEWKSPDG